MNIAHLLDFDFQSTAIGNLRVGALNKVLRSSIEQEVEQGEVDARNLATRVFVDTAHHVTGIKSIDSVSGGPAVTSDDMEKLREDDLDRFAERYGALFFGRHNSKGPSGDEPRGIHYLVFQIGESTRLRRESNAKLLANVKKLQMPRNISSMVRDLDFAEKLRSSFQFDAVQKALDEQRRWEDIRKVVAPLEQIRKSLDADTSWKKLFDDLSKPLIAANQFSKIFEESSAISSALKHLHETPRWEASLQHAQNAFAAAGIANQFLEVQKAFSNVQGRWQLPRYLVESLSSLSALEAQIGRLTLPVIDWNSAATLARYLGPQGLLDELATLGIDENGELTIGSVAAGDGGFISPKVRDLLLMLSIIVMILVPIYQEWSSAQSIALLEGKADAHLVVLEKQAKQLESLSRLVEAAIVKGSAHAPTRFVVLHRDATVRRRPESSAQTDGRLLPREVVTLVSENRKWIEVRYYHWALKEYQTGWVLKKYFARVPSSQQTRE